MYKPMWCNNSDYMAHYKRNKFIIVLCRKDGSPSYLIAPWWYKPVQLYFKARRFYWYIIDISLPLYKRKKGVV